MKRRHRIRRSADYEAVRKARVSVGDELLRVQLRRTGAAPRVGMTVSKQFGGAVQRNRMKRRLRELSRTELAGMPQVDLVLAPSRAAGAASYRRLAHSLRGMLQRLEASR